MMILSVRRRCQEGARLLERADLDVKTCASTETSLRRSVWIARVVWIVRIAACRRSAEVDTRLLDAGPRRAADDQTPPTDSLPRPLPPRRRREASVRLIVELVPAPGECRPGSAAKTRHSTGARPEESAGRAALARFRL